MSFRNRLTLFFVVIVVVPMVVTAAVVGGLVDDVDRERAKERLAQAEQTALAVHEGLQSRAAVLTREIGRDAGLAEVIRAGDRDGMERELRALARRKRTAALRLDLSAEDEVLLVGDADAIAPSWRQLLDGGESLGTLSVSVATARDFVRQVKRLTRRDVAIVDARGRELAGTVDDIPDDLGQSGETAVDGAPYRYQTEGIPGLGGQDLELQLLLKTSDVESPRPDLIILLALGAALLVAVLSALLISRSLQAEVNRLLEATRKIGRGEFRVDVPADGKDDFSKLGQQVNLMAAELEQRVADLKHERGRLQSSIRRVGESFAKGLDRASVLKIVTETAVDGTSARCGRTMLQPAEGILRPGAVAGSVEGHEAALRAAEASAMDTQQLQEARVGDVVAMAHPMRVEGGGRVVGVLAVAREGAGYTEADRDLLQYLAGQAAVSIENVSLHETVQRQAVTDELTGLFNHRHLQEVLAAEVERTRRFEQQLGLIMVDIDDFKRVNDSYGHLQGDLVLREVARVLRETAREIDIPARYGGEEMAVVLPQTDMQGAFRFAERVRRRIERLDLPLLDRSGTLHITASLGVAAIPGSAAPTKDALVGAADAALYRAKREGKNRTERADAVPSER